MAKEEGFYRLGWDEELDNAIEDAHGESRWVVGGKFWFYLVLVLVQTALLIHGEWLDRADARAKAGVK